jgi:uncharacterized oxidoreductase
MFSVLVDPAQLGTAQHFAAEAEAYIAWLRQSPSPGGAGITIAGEPERAARRRAAEQGLCIDVATWREIREAGETLGLPAARLEQLAAGRG